MTKTKLHPRNLHRENYDFDSLVRVNLALKDHLVTRSDGEVSIDYSKAKSVYELNKSLLLSHYRLLIWDIPESNLCPAVPGRADYIHYLADLLAHSNDGSVPTGKQVRLLDIGTGASLIYPIIAEKAYQWRTFASDIDSASVKIASHIAKANKLSTKVYHQRNSQHIFKNIIDSQSFFTITCCNPPFYSSAQEAEKANLRKRKNLNLSTHSARNFSGQKAELFCAGGEKQFIETMIKESKDVADNVLWFTTLVSQKANLAPLQKQLKQIGACQSNVINMAQGQKTSHILAWSFIPESEHTQYLN